MRGCEQKEMDGVLVKNVSDRLTGFQLAGPKAREILQTCTRDDISDMAFMDVRPLTVGMVDCLVQRVSYTGDLGFEIFCDPMAQRALWQTLWEAGEPLGMRPFGMRALMSLRLEHFFRSWLSEYSPDYTAAETGLDRFIAFKKQEDFIGRAAAEHDKEVGPDRRLWAFEVNSDGADEPASGQIWLDGEVVGFCTSGGYAHNAKKSVAIGFVPTERISDDLEVEIEILGKMRPARLLSKPLFDGDGARMKG